MPEPSFKQMQEFFRQVEAGRITSVNFQEFIKNPNRVSERVVVEGMAFVDYTVPTCTELKKSFDWVSDLYNEKLQVNFTAIEKCRSVSREPRDVVFKLFHFGYTISTANVLIELDNHGLRPALFEELLAFAKVYPDVQKNYLIAAPGSVCVGPFGISLMAYLSVASDSGRFLDAHRTIFDWHDDCYFLTVSK